MIIKVSKSALATPNDQFCRVLIEDYVGDEYRLIVRTMGDDRLIEIRIKDIVGFQVTENLSITFTKPGYSLTKFD